MILGNPERRRHRRFPVALALEYRLRSGGGGSGNTLNLSSGGLCFAADRALPPGEMIEVDIRWPVAQDHQRALHLRMEGLILRSGSGGTAVSVSKFEFRAIGSQPDTGRRG
jgi:hypothetical protein